MTDMTAVVFASLASPEAIGLLVQLLERDELGATVTELQAATELPQPTVTRALQALAQAGLLSRDRTTKAYAVASPEAVRHLLDQASDLALGALKARTVETEALQRRVRKSRLSTTRARQQTGQQKPGA